MPSTIEPPSPAPVQPAPIVELDEPSPAFVRARRRVLLATMFCYLFYYTGRQTFGFAMPGIEQELGIGKTYLGWVSATLLWTYAIGQVINGNLGDQFGGRRMMSIGAVLSCACNWALSFTTGLRGLFITWGANGFAQSMGWAPGSRVLSNWYDHAHRGRAYGCYVFAAGMSSVLAFAMSSLILSLDLNWRWIFRLPVLLLLVGGAMYYWLVRDRPEDLGFNSVHDPQDKVVDPSDVEVGSVEKERALDRYLKALSNWRFLLASLSIGFQSSARYGLLIWVPVHLLGSNWQEDTLGKWTSLSLPLGMALGALVSGWLSDRLFDGNRSRLIVLFMGLAGVTCGAMYLLADNLWASVPLLFVAGFFAYGPQAAYWALCPDLLGHQRAGTGTGIMNSFAYLFAGLGEPLIGWLIETRGETSIVYLIVSVSCFSAAILAIGVRR